MCGIIGYVGYQQAAPILLEGLARLEYRGYDSAGIAVVDHEGELVIRKAPGKLRNLINTVENAMPRGCTGLGHTRWATHGEPSELNSHPHTDCRGQVIVVHNGIVENYSDLKAGLLSAGHTFSSETDTEVIPHLIEEELARGNGFEDAFRAAVRHLRGAQAVAATWSGAPQTLLGVRLGNAGGIAVGYGQGEMFLASDLPALLPLTSHIAFLTPGDVATLSPTETSYSDLQGALVSKTPRTMAYNPVTAVKGIHKHFMLKEIMEEPECVTNTLRGRVFFDPEDISLPEVPFAREEIRSLSRVVLVGMGTSYHAAQVGSLMVEQMAGIPATAENAAEFRYREPLVDRHTLVVSIGQSGETADTLAAIEEANRQGARNITICNIDDSQATRLAEGTISMRAALEIGVAATKTFVNTLACLYLLSAHLGRQRGFLTEAALKEGVHALARLPQLLGRVLEQTPAYERVARLYFQRNNFLYIGRGIHVPIALEGALKLKEISYIHAEGTAAAELKHGPIALVDSSVPVVALCLRDNLYDKMLANIAEVKTRNGVVIAIGTEGDQDLEEKADHVLYVPEVPYLLSPLVSVVPLQLLAYHIAVLRGCDVDQPRNLAKSVTVE